MSGRVDLGGWVASGAVVVSVKAQGAGGWRYHEDSADKARAAEAAAREAPAGEAGLAGYYGTDAARPGRWVGAAEDLARYRLGAPRGLVDREQLAAVMDGGRLGDGTEVLPAPAGGGVRAGRALYDVTYSAPKSVSVLWSDADAAGRARVEEAVLRSAETVLADLSGHAAFVRRGKTPAEQRQHGARGLVAAAYVEGTSRAGDPQLHVHLLVPSAVQGTDGRWSRLDARGLYPESRTADAVAHAVLRRELSEALGVAWGPVQQRTGAAEVVGVDLAEVAAASRRSEQIAAYVAEHRGAQEAAKGRPLSAGEMTALRQEACLRTRAAKEVQASEAVVAGWQDGRDTRTGTSREQRWAGYRQAWQQARQSVPGPAAELLRGAALLAETARRVARPTFTAAQVRRVAAQTLDPQLPAGRVLEAVDAAGRDALGHAVALTPAGSRDDRGAPPLRDRGAAGRGAGRGAGRRGGPDPDLRRGVGGGAARCRGAGCGRAGARRRAGRGGRASDQPRPGPHAGGAGRRREDVRVGAGGAGLAARRPAGGADGASGQGRRRGRRRDQPGGRRVGAGDDAGPRVRHRRRRAGRGRAAVARPAGRPGPHPGRGAARGRGRGGGHGDAAPGAELGRRLRGGGPPGR